MPKRQKAFIAVVIIITLLIVCLFIPYFVADNLTKKYGEEFSNLYSENGFYSNIEYLRVLQYRDKKVNIYYLDNDRLKKELTSLSNDYAVVLYIEENHSSASLFIFYDEGGQWKLSNWNLIWSTSGSADGFMWPYYF